MLYVCACRNGRNSATYAQETRAWAGLTYRAREAASGQRAAAKRRRVRGGFRW